MGTETTAPRNTFIGLRVRDLTREEAGRMDWIPAACVHCGEPVAVELEAIAYAAAPGHDVACRRCEAPDGREIVTSPAQLAAIEREFGRAARRRVAKAIRHHNRMAARDAEQRRNAQAARNLPFL